MLEQRISLSREPTRKVLLLFNEKLFSVHPPHDVGKCALGSQYELGEFINLQRKHFVCQPYCHVRTM